jgi:hypothetical protein
MVLELIIIASFLFAVFVWFYKQRRSELELLQVEFSQAATSLRDLAQEKQPIIIRGVPVPPVLTTERLAEIPRLDNFPLDGVKPLAANATLGAYKVQPAAVNPDAQRAGQPLLTDDAGAALSDELAMPMWVNRSLGDALLDLGSLPFLTTTETRVLLGGAGLQRALGSYVCIVPTQGTYNISLVSASSEQFLPKAWDYRYPQSFTINDTPMVGEIKYVEVIVRPGTMLCVPAQTLFAAQPKEFGPFHAALIIEVHSPVSRMAKLLESV